MQTLPTIISAPELRRVELSQQDEVSQLNLSSEAARSVKLLSRGMNNNKTWVTESSPLQRAMVSLVCATRTRTLTAEKEGGAKKRRSHAVSLSRTR